MNMKISATAAASAALAVMMGANAVAADATTVNSELKNPGVSLVDRGNRTGIKDVVFEAGTDPSAVVLHFSGAEKISFADVGTLLIVKADGTRWLYKPSVYQVIDGKRKLVTVGFHFVGRDRVSLKVQKLDSSAPLVFGPVTGKNGNS